MSGMVYINSDVQWFGSTIVIQDLVDTFLEKYEKTMTENEMREIDGAEGGSKIMSLSSITKQEYQRFHLSMKQMLVDVVSTHGKYSEHPTVDQGVKIVVAELATVFLLGDQAEEDSSRVVSIQFSDTHNWITPFWVWQLINLMIVIDLQKLDSSPDLERIEQSRQSNLDSHDFTGLDKTTLTRMTETIAYLKKRYDDGSEEYFGCMTLKVHGNDLMSNLNNLLLILQSMSEEVD